MKPTDIRVKDAQVTYFEDRLRTPLVLSTGPITCVTRARVELTVETRDGRVGRGVGEMSLSDAWAFPTEKVPHSQRDAVMRRLTERFAHAVTEHTEPDHPIGLFEDTVLDLDAMRKQVSAEAGLAEDLPRLGALVCASACDLAVHDAYGRVLERCSYHLLGRDHGAELGRWLGPAFAGKALDAYVTPDPEPFLNVLHLVGAGDKLTAEEVTADDPQDGLPVTLPQWIDRDGVFQFKVKIKGTDLDWDTDRIVAVYRVAREALARQDGRRPVLTVDTNERCADPSYGVELLNRLRDRDREAFDALALFEQPTERDLTRSRHDQRPLAALRPVLVDEGLTDPDGLDLAVELGWSGVALKVCKGLSSSLLIVARAKELGLELAVMDLTLPGRALVHSAGFAARVGSRLGVEANGRQYVPHACPELQARMPEFFTVRDGRLRTAAIGPLGLGGPLDG